MPEITMYGTQTRPYCLRAEKLLRRKGAASMRRIAVDLDPSRRVETVQRSGRRSVPQIFIGDIHVGGHDELVALDRQGEIDELIVDAVAP